MGYLRVSLAMAVVLAAASTGLADIIYVPDHHDTIQEAIIASSNGDSIIVRPGPYVENIDFLGKAITLKSEMGADVTLIDGGSPPDPERASVVTFRNGEGPGSVLDGFTLTNGTGTFCGIFPGITAFCGGGIVCLNYSSPTIINNIVSGNSSASEGGGIGCVRSSPTITRNTITDNQAVGNSGGGLYVSWSSAPTISFCTVVRNWADHRGGGISNMEYSFPTVANCTFSGNVAGLTGGGMYSNRSYPTVTNCIFWGDTSEEIAGYLSSTTVTCSCVQGGYEGTGNIDEDPLFCNPEIDDFTLCADSPCAAENYPECGKIGAWSVGCGACGPAAVPAATPTCALDLVPNSPNPFTAWTTIRYDLPLSLAGQKVVLRVYDLSGRPVRSLVSGTPPAATHSVSWDGTDEWQQPVAGGIYFYRLMVGDQHRTRRLVLIR